MALEALRPRPHVFVPASAMRWWAARSSGPGGQKVNTSATKVELRIDTAAIRGLDERGLERLRELAGHRWLDTGELRIVSETARTQPENLRLCLARANQLIADASEVPRRRRATRPTRASKQRRLDAKKARGATKRMRGPVDSKD